VIAVTPSTVTKERTEEDSCCCAANEVPAAHSDSKHESVIFNWDSPWLLRTRRGRDGYYV
jgi:hypothetical protein